MLIDDQCRIFICDFGMSRTLPDTYKGVRKVKKKEYHKVTLAPTEERLSREMKFKSHMSEFLRTRPKLDDERDVTCCVMTRVYRAPEVILTCKDYGHEADIWSLGLVLAELMMNVYAGENKRRVLFQGK